MENQNRRNAIKNMAIGTAALSGIMSLSTDTNAEKMGAPLKGNIKQSAVRWCYGDIPLEDFCKAVRDIGLTSIELVGYDEWQVMKKYGLHSALPWYPNANLQEGFSHVEFHAKLQKDIGDFIPVVAKAGFNNLICFSGNRGGISEEEGLRNSVIGLKPLLPIAEKHGVTLTMELLNSKVDHKDYQCDHTAWGVELCKRLGSERFKLLYDIYHMQIMEGDIIRTIKENIQYISHFHTGGNPGRNEIDETQELNYPAIMRAILETGYKGYVGQEFIPKNPNKIESLRKCVAICDI